MTSLAPQKNDRIFTSNKKKYVCTRNNRNCTSTSYFREDA